MQRITVILVSIKKRICVAGSMITVKIIYQQGNVDKEFVTNRHIQGINTVVFFLLYDKSVQKFVLLGAF